jgi:hypothetical protein
LFERSGGCNSYFWNASRLLEGKDKLTEVEGGAEQSMGGSKAYEAQTVVIMEFGQDATIDSFTKKL